MTPAIVAKRLGRVGDAMAMKMDVLLWGRLPVELEERVLSFLPIPVLCRFRKVCKRWNSLVMKPRFQNLCEMNGRKDNYLCVTRYVIYSDWCYVDPSFLSTISFLDLAERKWYTIKTGVETSRHHPCQFILHDSDSRLLAMDDGLLCDLAGIHDTLFGTQIVMFDPVARVSRKLCAPPTCCPTDALPIISIAVNDATSSFKVFFINNCAKVYARIHMYKSASDTWGKVKNPPASIGVTGALSAVFFRESLYVVFQTDAWNKFVVLRYSSGEDIWYTCGVNVPDKPAHPQLVVHDGKLFLMVWSFDNRVSAEIAGVTGDHGVKSTSCYEVIEILVPDNTSKRVLRISTEQLHKCFQEEDVDIAYGIPTLDSAGACSSVILVSSLSGKIIDFDAATGNVDELPRHPLGSDVCLDETDCEGIPVTASFGAKHMNLTLRNLSNPYWS